MIDQIVYKCFALKNITAEKIQARLVVPLEKSLSKNALGKTPIQNFLSKGSDSEAIFISSYSFSNVSILLPYQKEPVQAR